MKQRDRIRQAIALGPLAMLRLRAEVLLQRIDDPERPVVILESHRETLHRIASVPRPDDWVFLHRFDFIYAQDHRKGG